MKQINKENKVLLLQETLELLEEAMSTYDSLPNGEGFDEDYYQRLQDLISGIEYDLEELVESEQK